MWVPERFSGLPSYPFVRLRRLLDRHSPGRDVIDMSVGEPRHEFPAWIAAEIARSIEGFGRYPSNDGEPELLDACAAWIRLRYNVHMDPGKQLMALSGSREGLYNSCIALCPERKNGGSPTVLIPNPFYQVYAAGALAAGAEPVFVPATRATGYLPDFAALPKSVLNRAALMFICSPSNPQGAVASIDYLRELISLAEQYDFQVMSDECYGEIYSDDPPPGLLEAISGDSDPERALVFHSLSKRSNLPGMRSGFVAGGAMSIGLLRQLRAYGGAPPPTALQRVAARVWSDEAHVQENRSRYLVKHSKAIDLLGTYPGFSAPDAGFFLWLEVGDDEDTAQRLWRKEGVRVLPGTYFGRDDGNGNPGEGHIRVALVADDQEVADGLHRIQSCLN